MEHPGHGPGAEAIRDYYFGGSGAESTLSWNRRDWDAIELVPRVLRNVAHLDTTVDLAGRRIPVPLVVAPMAYTSLLHPRAEAVIAEAAARHGVSYCLSTRSAVPLEEVADAFRRGLKLRGGSGTKPLLAFQLYVMRDHRFSDSLVRRAAKSGYEAIYVTVDAPFIGIRMRDRENSFAVPEEFLSANISEELEGWVVEESETRFGSGVSSARFSGLAPDPGVDWSGLGDIIDLADGMLVFLKGVLSAADLALAGGLPVAGVVVSNHGGRQLDGSISTARALYRMESELREYRGAVLVDGAISSGADVVRALGLGAKAAMVGRHLARALYERGEEGLDRAVSLLVEDVKVSLALAGASRPEMVERSQLLVPPGW
ncbi:MAG: alpha-hydroxy acid oxidase [Actinomycetota bacterium]|nr:alpha-hydroxy acid oxidase [Actinomycetota bacterium]